MPVLLADPAAGVVGVAHAGRRGLVAGVVPAVIATMRELGAAQIHRPDRSVGVRPLLRGAEPSCAPLSRTNPASWADEPTRARRLSTWQPASRPSCVRAGVDVRTIEGCTVEDPSLYSYRRERTTGRLAGVAWLPVPGSATVTRRAEIATGLAAVTARVERACRGGRA